MNTEEANKMLEVFHIPCTREKCLKFPACKNRGIIYCMDLLSFFESTFRVDYSGNERANLWLDINRVLPNVVRIFPEPKDDCILNTYNVQSPYAAEYLRYKNRVDKRFTNEESY